MANFTQNLSDSIRFFGIQPTSKWGSPMVWGTDKWGNGGTNFKLSERIISFNNDTETLTDSFSTPLRMTFVETPTFVQNALSETLRTGNGYLVVLQGGATNAENATVASYTVLSNPSSSWSVSTASATTWVKL